MPFDFTAIDYEISSFQVVEIDLPSGEYFFGDPCYAFKNEGSENSWANLLDSSTSEDLSVVAGKTQDNMHVVAYNTAYGDGYYNAFDNTGHNIAGIPVDAGLIGLTDVRIADAEGINRQELLRLGAILTLDNPKISVNGVSTITVIDDHGRYFVRTSD